MADVLRDMEEVKEVSPRKEMIPGLHKFTRNTNKNSMDSNKPFSRHLLVTETGKHGYLPMLVSSICYLTDVSDVIITGLNATSPGVAEKLQNFGIANTYLTKSTIEMVSKSRGKYAMDTVKAILLNPECTKSAICDPVSYFLDEAAAGKFNTLSPSLII